MIRSPEFYGKKEHAASAKARRDYILQAMVDRGWLTAKDGRAAIASKLGVIWSAKPRGIANSEAPFFLEKVRQYLVARYGAEAVNLGGLRVRTTLDMDMQDLADADGQADPGRPEDTTRRRRWSPSTRATGRCGPCTAAGTSRAASSTTPPTPSARPARP